MATNNKVIVFTDDMSVRKAFYALVSNSTRTGLIADSNSMQLTGVLSITDFTMMLMMLWKFRENIEEMKGTPLSHREFNGMDIANMKISRWKELLRRRGNLREFISVSSCESIFHAVELLSKYRIHRLPVLDKHSGDCAFILTHRRVLRYIWKYCSCLSRPDYMYECVCDLKVGTYTGIHYATQEMSLLEVLDMMIDNSISGVPIIQESTIKVSHYQKSICFSIGSSELGWEIMIEWLSNSKTCHMS
ncbi:CBS domain protein [Oesophagostomum dentatum]|uniref:CBS domain protein n=1 Tax=Oesophagostomum dentatum TaxID=61180 RepID=A0A0B1SZT4_OESDE|nr:CBS domain protein [Oesophagostomum dentatum]